MHVYMDRMGGGGGSQFQDSEFPANTKTVGAIHALSPSDLEKQLVWWVSQRLPASQASGTVHQPAFLWLLMVSHARIHACLASRSVDLLKSLLMGSFGLSSKPYTLKAEPSTPPPLPAGSEWRMW
jgi:hypothetical protein